MRSGLSDSGALTRFYGRRENSIIFLCGGMLVALSVSMVPSLLVALIDGEDPSIMGLPIIIGLLLGMPILMSYRMSTVVRPPDALAMMAALWLS